MGCRISFPCPPRKDNSSVASSSAPESSLLLGLHTVDFSRLQVTRSAEQGGSVVVCRGTSAALRGAGH